MTFTELSVPCNSEAFHSNPWPLDPLNPFKIINSFGDDSKKEARFSTREDLEKEVVTDSLKITWP